VKRLFDIIVAFLALIVLSPVFLFIAALMKYKMPGPVLFRQWRTGRNGVPFRIIKFRTMVVDHGGNTTSVRGEKRITPLGACLRRYKLDELPELWNVLVGDMSLVGPRPDVPEFTDRLVGEQSLILTLRPGITGPASLKYANEEEILASVPDPVKYTNEVIWPDKVRLNLGYYRNRSLTGDFILILRTVLRSI